MQYTTNNLAKIHYLKSTLNRVVISVQRIGYSGCVMVVARSWQAMMEMEGTGGASSSLYSSFSSSLVSLSSPSSSSRQVIYFFVLSSLQLHFAAAV